MYLVRRTVAVERIYIYADAGARDGAIQDLQPRLSNYPRHPSTNSTSVGHESSRFTVYRLIAVTHRPMDAVDTVFTGDNPHTADCPYCEGSPIS